MHFHSKMAWPPAAYDVITIVTDHHQTFLKMPPLQKTSDSDVYRLGKKKIRNHPSPPPIVRPRVEFSLSIGFTAHDVGRESWKHKNSVLRKASVTAYSRVHDRHHFAKLPWENQNAAWNHGIDSATLGWVDLGKGSKGTLNITKHSIPNKASIMAIKRMEISGAALAICKTCSPPSNIPPS